MVEGIGESEMEEHNRTDIETRRSQYLALLPGRCKEQQLLMMPTINQLLMCVRVQDCPKNCLVCSLQSGKPYCNPNGCNSTHAFKADDGTCVGEF